MSLKITAPGQWNMLASYGSAIGGINWSTINGTSGNNELLLQRQYFGSQGKIDLGAGIFDMVNIDLVGAGYYNLIGVEFLNGFSRSSATVYLTNLFGNTLTTNGGIANLFGTVAADVITVTGNRGAIFQTSGARFTFQGAVKGAATNTIDLGAGNDRLILVDNIDRTGQDRYSGGLGANVLELRNTTAGKLTVTFTASDSDIANFQTVFINNAGLGDTDANFSGQTEGLLIYDALTTSVTAFSGNDEITGGRGNDTIYARGGRDDVNGHDGNDTIYGGGDFDNISGGAGNDTIYGNAGTYNGVTGDQGNRVTGNAGFDTFMVGYVDNVTGATVPAGYAATSNPYGADVIQDWTSGTDTLNVSSAGVGIIGGLDTDASLSGANTISLRTNVSNNGLIVARGKGDNDSITDSSGVDYLYGNSGSNQISLGAGGNDRAYVDTISGKQYITGFSSGDLVYLSKGVVDALGQNTGRGGTINNASGNTHNGQQFITGQDYLYANFYFNRLSNFGAGPYTNQQHNSANDFGDSGNTTPIGAGLVTAGAVLLACTFGIVGASLVVAGGFLLVDAQQHQNITYDGAFNNNAYLNLMAQSQTVNTTVGANDDGVQFLDFFRSSANVGDGFTPVLELTNKSGAAGIYGLVAVHSNSETFIYLVRSADNLIENHEAMKIAEINGILGTSDFVIYDGAQDIYNPGTDPVLVLVEPTITAADAGSSTGVADITNGGTTTDNKATLSVSLSPALGTAATTIDLYDGATYVTSVSRSSTSATTITDTRTMSAKVEQVDLDGDGNPLALSGDNLFRYDYTDAYYSVWVRDPATGFVTKSNVWAVTYMGIDPSLVIDGGSGFDTLMIERTSDHLNSVADNKLLNIEMIDASSAAQAVTITLTAQGEGFTLSGGEYNDVLTGGGGADTLLGNGGADSLSGGNGDDIFVYAALTRPTAKTAIEAFTDDTTIAGNAGTDMLRFIGNVTLTDAPFADVTSVEQLDLDDSSTLNTVTLGAYAQSAGTYYIDGSNGADTISWDYNSLDVTIYAKGGDDIIDNDANDARADTVYGGDGNDTISTGGGDDMIYGDADNDTIYGEAGSDTISGGAGNDTIVGGAGADVLTGNAGDDRLTGGTDADTFNVDAGNDTVSDLGDGADIVKVESGATLAASAAAAWTATSGSYNKAAAASAATITASGYNIDLSAVTGTTGWTVTNSGNATGVTLTGSSFADTITGGSGDDTLVGGAGADVLTGGAGNNTLTGGTGADTFNVNLGSAIIIDLGDGVDNIKIESGAAVSATAVGAWTATSSSYNKSFGTNASGSIAASGYDIDLSAATGTKGWTISNSGNATAVMLTGSTFGDNIIGGTGADTLNGGDGNDVLSGAVGSDTIFGGNGTDNLSGGDDNDFLTGGAGADTLFGDNGDDILLFASSAELAADTSVSGGAGTDTIYITVSDSDVVDSEFSRVTGVEQLQLTRTSTVALGSNAQTAGIATIYGGDGADTISWIYTSLGVTIYGYDGDDVIDQNDSLGDPVVADWVDGGAGNDRIWTGNGADTIYGGTGNDQISGEGGADILIGGAGADTVNFGGADSAVDTAVYYNGDTATGVIADGSPSNLTNVDVISGAEVGDKIDLTNITNLTLADGTVYQTMTFMDGTYGNAVEIIRGSWDGSKFTSGLAASDDDYLLQFSNGTTSGSVNSIVINDFSTAGMTVDISSDVLTLGESLPDNTNPTVLSAVYYNTGNSTYPTELYVTFSENVQSASRVIVESGVRWDFDSDNPFNDPQFPYPQFPLDYFADNQITGQSSATADSLRFAINTGQLPGFEGGSFGSFGGSTWDAIDFDAGVTRDLAGNATVAAENIMVQYNWQGTSGADVIYGGGKADMLYGNDGADTIYGSAGGDTIDGGLGADIIYSGDAIAVAPLAFDAMVRTGSFTQADYLDRKLFGIGANAGVDNDALPRVTVTGTIDDSSTYFRIDLVAGETITLDIDDFNGLTSWDSTLTLYDAAGIQLAYNNNNGNVIADADPGSQTHLDSFLTYTATATGTYYIKIDRSGDPGGYYTMHVSLDMRDGVDTITGGAGDDIIHASEGDDSIDGGLNNDTLVVTGSGAFATDNRLFNVENVLLNDLASGDTVTFAGQTEGFVFTLGADTNDLAPDSITLSDGNDTLLNAQNIDNFSGSSYQQVYGGGGTDMLSFSNNWDDAFDNNINSFEKVVLTTGGLTVILNDQTEGFEFTGSSGNDRITGGSGNDTFYDSDGTDTLFGGSGSDGFVFASFTDLANTTFDGGGIIDEYNRVIFTTAFVNLSTFDSSLSTMQNVSQVQLAGSSSINLGATAKASGVGAVVTGNGSTTIQQDISTYGQVNVLAGGMADNTTLTLTQGLSGFGTFYVAGAKSDVNASGITGYVHAYAAAGTGFGVSFTGGSADDILVGGAGNDTLTGGNGNDTINGGYAYGNSVPLIAETTYPNDTTATAQYLDTFGFGIASSVNVDDASLPRAHVFGSISTGNDVDYYKIDLVAGQLLTLDVDNDALMTSLDSYVEVYDAAGNPVAFNDDSSPMDSGSSSTRDSFLTYTAGQTGTYYIRVGSYAGGSSGDYAMNVSVSALSGNDMLTGGAGNDTLTGGNGPDTFVFAATGATNGVDTIDFNASQGDVVNLAAFLPGGSASGVYLVNTSAQFTNNVTGQVALLLSANSNSVSDLDTAAEVADAFNVLYADKTVLTLDLGGKAVIVTGEDTSAQAGYIWFVHDIDNNGVTESDVVQVGFIDSIQFTTSGFSSHNFVFA